MLALGAAYRGRARDHGPMIDHLAPSIGEWNVETSLGPASARTTFEWALDGTFVLQRSTIEIPEAPDALCIIAAEGEGSVSTTSTHAGSCGCTR